MKPSLALRTYRDDIRRVVAANRATNPRIFGSTARAEDTEDSDLDLLVDPLAETTLFDLGAIRSELTALLGIPVDILTPNALPARIRGAVIDGAIPV